MDQLTIHFHFKHAATTGNESQALDALAEGTQQRGRQTDGLWGVVSHHAERNRHIHNCLLMGVSQDAHPDVECHVVIIDAESQKTCEVLEGFPALATILR